MLAKLFFMQFPSPVSAQWIARFINAEITGNEDAPATGVHESHDVSAGDIVLVDHPKYYDTCHNSSATFIIIDNQTAELPGTTWLSVDQPFEAYSKIVQHFRTFATSYKMISDTATTGKNSIIMPNVFLGNHVVVGDNCIIHPNVSIYDYSIIGNNVEIHTGAVFGSDPFYLNKKPFSLQKRNLFNSSVKPSPLTKTPNPPQTIPISLQKKPFSLHTFAIPREKLQLFVKNAPSLYKQLPMFVTRH